MEDNLPTYQIIKDAPKVLPMIYKDCAQPSVKKIGQALATVFEFSNTILLPLKLINEKARLNFQKHMDNFQKKLEDIPSEKIADIPPIIGTPIIDRLTYITNDEISDLFINLLAKASSIDSINEVHPAFIHIIDRMSVDEARLINHLSNSKFIPFINVLIRRKENAQEYQKIAWNWTGLEFDVELLCPKNIDTYLDNLSSLQIIESQGSIYKTNQDLYKRLEEKYSSKIKEFEGVISSSTEYNACEIQKGFYEITELGKSFFKVVKNKSSADSESNV